jgi:hypothetical protein
MTRINQHRTNPSQAVSNFKGRWDSVFGWPSTAVSTWLNGGLFGGGVFTLSAEDADDTQTYQDVTRYIWTGDGSFTVSKAGYADIFMIGGGGGGSQGGGGQIGGGGGAGGVLHITDVYIDKGTWDVDVGGSGSETFIYEDGNISAPLTDARMGANADVKSNFAVSASRGGNGAGGNGGDPGGDHALNDEQQGSGGGGGTNSNLNVPGTGGTGGSSGDIGYDGKQGLSSSGGYYNGGGGGGAGGVGTGNSSYGGSFTDGGDGITNTYASGSGASAYYAVGGSSDLWTVFWVSTNNKCDTAVYEDIGGWSGWQTDDADNYGDANTGSGGGGGYTVSGSGGSGLVILMTRLEDA